MLYGHVRDHSPRVLLTLMGASGPVSVEFVVDTGFEGELALPPALVAQVAIGPPERQIIALADGRMSEVMAHYTDIDWNGDSRPTEIMILEGNPLLGMLLLDGFQIHIEASDGGEVLIEPL